MRRRLWSAQIWMCIAGAATSALADPDTIYVRSSCSGAPTPCYSSVAAATNWAHSRDTGPPGEDQPLLIDIGAGTFGPLVCFDLGNTTFRGVGTVAEGGAYTRLANSFPFVVSGSNCDHVTFQNMTIGGAALLYAVAWKNSGDTIWENVELEGSGWSWYDACWENGSIGLHYFFDSQATTLALGQEEGFQVSCSELWWYGGGIRFVSDTSEGPASPDLTGIEVTGNGDLRVIGSKIHAVASWGPSQTVDSLTGVRVRQ